MQMEVDTAGKETAQVSTLHCEVEVKQLCTVIGGIVLIIALIVIGALFYAIPVYFLWNWLMPLFFGLHQVTIFQAWGIACLSGLLFKSSSTSEKK